MPRASAPEFKRHWSIYECFDAFGIRGQWPGFVGLGHWATLATLETYRNLYAPPPSPYYTFHYMAQVAQSAQS
jgi:hypothetical protein